MGKRLVTTTVRCLAAVGVILTLLLAGAAPSNHNSLPTSINLFAE